MLYLYGITHDHQCFGGEKDDEATKLKKALLPIVKEKKIEVLAEEFNQDALTDTKCSKTVLQAIKESDNSLEHIFCEMSRAERRQKKIKEATEIKHQMFMNDEEITEESVRAREREYYPLREAHWLKMIKGCSGRKVLFVCGADHIKSFSSLLNENSIENCVVGETVNGT